MLPERFLKGRMQVRHYTQGDFDRAGRLDRLYIHMLHPQFHLHAEEDKLLGKLRRVFELTGDLISRKDAVEAIVNDFDCSTQAAVGFYHEASELFGRMLQVNKKYDRAIIREKLAKLAKRAEEAEDNEEARKCYEAIIKLDGLENKDDETEPPSEAEPATIIFTNAKKALEITEAE